MRHVSSRSKRRAPSRRHDPARRRLVEDDAATIAKKLRLKEHEREGSFWSGQAQRSFNVERRREDAQRAITHYEKVAQLARELDDPKYAAAVERAHVARLRSMLAEGDPRRDPLLAKRASLRAAKLTLEGSWAGRVNRLITAHERAARVTERARPNIARLHRTAATGLRRYRETLPHPSRSASADAYESSLLIANAWKNGTRS